MTVMTLFLDAGYTIAFTVVGGVGLYLIFSMLKAD
jgi:hypothetical protein